MLNSCAQSMTVTLGILGLEGLPVSTICWIPTSSSHKPPGYLFVLRSQVQMNFFPHGDFTTATLALLLNIIWEPVGSLSFSSWETPWPWLFYPVSCWGSAVLSGHLRRSFCLQGLLFSFPGRSHSQKSSSKLKLSICWRNSWSFSWWTTDSGEDDEDRLILWGILLFTGPYLEMAFLSSVYSLGGKLKYIQSSL